MQQPTYRFFILLLASLALSACGGGGDSGGGGGGGASTSHNAGQNCLNSGCHASGGTARVFSAAGTVYKSGSVIQPSATIKFYEPNSSVVIATIPTDASGNFYTSIDLSSYLTSAGFDADVTGPSGGTNTMQNPAIGGGCNGSGCHDSGRRLIAN